MVWFFERGSAVLELETSYDNATLEYVLVVRPPGETPAEERFADADRFRIRLQQIESELAADDWQPNGPPRIVPAGWPEETPPR